MNGFVVCGHGFVRLGHGFTRHPVDWHLAAARVHLPPQPSGSLGGVEAAEEADIPMIVSFFFQTWAGTLFHPLVLPQTRCKISCSPDFQAAISELD